MARTMVVLVGDDRDQCEKLKTMSQGMGCTVHVFTPTEWGKALNDQGVRTRLMGDVPALSVGSSPITEGAKILQFPQPSLASDDDKKVRTINELESIAIENAIHEFGGNLTEAAKALGIGRATLYRKVKQYNIDPANARKKRAA
jgi:DNA-binding NtrC family response regulator